MLIEMLITVVLNQLQINWIKLTLKNTLPKTCS